MHPIRYVVIKVFEYFLNQIPVNLLLRAECERFNVQCRNKSYNC